MAQVRFTARGTLVVVPASVAAQWEAEIKASTVRPQRVVIVDDAKPREHYLSSVAGMRMCGVMSSLVLPLVVFDSCSRPSAAFEKQY